MKKLRYSILCLLLVMLIGIQVSAQNVAPYGNIIDTWIVHSVTNADDEYGMEVHANLEIFNHGTYEGYAAVLFFLEDGTPLKDYNGEYVANNGQVAASTTFVPISAEMIYDVSIFIPYSEMHIVGAKANLKCMVIAFDYNGNQLAVSEYLVFTLID